MKTAVNIITGFLFGISPVLGAAFFSIFIFDALPNFFGALIIGILITLSLRLGYVIFNKVQIIGPVEFVTAKNASPELDNLRLDSTSRTKTRTSQELVKLITANQHLLKGGSLRIYNDWVGIPFENSHQISHGAFDEKENILTIEFSKGEKLQIHNPTHIFEGKTFLKVVDADKVRFSWYATSNSNLEKQPYLDYIKKPKQILTDTNVDRKLAFNVSLGSPAVIIYSNYEKV